MDDQSPTGPPKTVPPPDPDRLRELRARAQAALEDQRRQTQDLEEKMSGEIARISDHLAEAFAQHTEDATNDASAAIAAERQALDAQRGEWEQLRNEIEANLEQVDAELQEKTAAVDESQRLLAEKESAIEAEKQELGKWAADLANQREEIEALRREVRQSEQQLQHQQSEADAAAGAAEAETASRLAELQAELNDAREQSRQEWEPQVSRLTEERDKLAEAAEQAAQVAGELQEKFDLALADVQQHRQRVAELEQELATRPANDANESAELAQLRQERDQLMRAIAELESRLAMAEAGAGSDPQETEDLRRRFELAVEDVRQLKTEKAELEERLASAGPAPSGSNDSGELDWEAQKRRLLESLQDEGPTSSPERTEERATIEGTIRITDEVVNEKDQQIARLHEQLAGTSGSHRQDPTDDPNLLDDERLENERQRLAELQQEWEGKLREAELELSVERAKIAREQAELADLKIEIEAQRRAGVPMTGNDGATEKRPQRNWLNKLGLGGGEEE